MEDSDQHNTVMDAIFETQQRIARKRQEDLEAAAAAGSAMVATDLRVGRMSPPDGHTQRDQPHAQLDARNHRSDFFTMWSKKIEAFITDASKTALDLPPELSANDRRELHTLADKFNLSHMSEGSGRERHLVLRKDVLHYKAPQLRPSSAAMEALKAAPMPPKPQQQNNGQRTVESRYELRRVRNRNDEPKYSSDTAERAMRRLDKATDHYRNAVEVGMTMEEFQHEASGESVDARLAASPLEQQQHSTTAGALSSRPAHSSGPSWSDALQQRVEPLATTAVNRSTKTYKEQCLSCGSQSPLDYDVSEWGCCGFCDVCAQDRIFRLVEVTNAPNPDPPMEIDRCDDDGSDEPPAKQQRTEKEEIDIDSDGGEMVEGAVVSAQEAKNILLMNDCPDKDVAFLSKFADAHERIGDLGNALLFAMDFRDVVTCDDPVLAPFTKRPGPDDLFLFVRGLPPSANATTMLIAALHALGISEGDVMRFTVVVPSTSLVGTALRLLVRIHGVPDASSPESALQAIAAKYGTSNFRIGRMDELERVAGSS